MDFVNIIQGMIESTLKTMRDCVDNKSHSDKTFTCKITEKISAGKYKVLYCGGTYTVSSSTAYQVGDYVRVCAPCNNWRDLFVVCKK